MNGVTTADAQLVMQHWLGLIELKDEQFRRADLNRDGVVDGRDAAAILRMILK